MWKWDCHARAMQFVRGTPIRWSQTCAWEDRSKQEMKRTSNLEPASHRQYAHRSVYAGLSAPRKPLPAGFGAVARGDFNRGVQATSRPQRLFSKVTESHHPHESNVATCSFSLPSFDSVKPRCVSRYAYALCPQHAAMRAGRNAHIFSIVAGIEAIFAQGTRQLKQMRKQRPLQPRGG